MNHSLPLIQEGKANVVIDAQWGSTGKGKLTGYLFEEHDIDYVVCDYMPNAGHTFYKDGKPVIVRQIPSGAFYGVPALIGPHAAIDLEVFNEELRQLPEDAPVFVHPLATIVEEADKAMERETTARLAGITKGGHASSARKALRRKDTVLAFEKLPKSMIADTQALAQEYHREGYTGLIETAQGFDLGLNHGKSYPYVTGRDCLVGRALDNAGLPVSAVGSIIACFRTFPIRVGNTAEGNSGPCYNDQQELNWDQMSAIAGLAVAPEMTTVSKRMRRVFTFSPTQLERFMRFVAPTHAFLNFVNYLGKHRDVFVESLGSYLADRNCRLELFGTGPELEAMEVRPKDKHYPHAEYFDGKLCLPPVPAK